MDAYFSADIETDGRIPGPFSMLSFALVYAGSYDGRRFVRPASYEQSIYLELQPISEGFEPEALLVNQLDRDRLCREGQHPALAMTTAATWVRQIAGEARPVLVAYPLCFDWSWLYWYFIQYSQTGSPFDHSSCFDIKTAFAVKGRRTVADASRTNLLEHLRSSRVHSHHALDDAIEQADIFGNIFEWRGVDG